MSGFDAVVYDLDGTLVRLDVDWSVVAADVRAVYAEASVEPPGTDVWTLLDAAAGNGLEGEVEATIAKHERAGARRAIRLDTADELPKREVPVGVCSLNCEEACRIALEHVGIADNVDAIVGRDTVNARKPDPTPLLRTVEALNGDPSSTIFVGDMDRDAKTARRAGTEFRYVEN